MMIKCLLAVVLVAVSLVCQSSRVLMLFSFCPASFAVAASTGRTVSLVSAVSLVSVSRSR
jgi:hypothetical protein